MMILDMCDNGDILTVMSYVKIFFLLIRIVVPIILIISLMIGYTKAVNSKDSDALHKANVVAVKKAIAAVLVFLIPTFVNTLAGISYIDSNLYISCIKKATKENITVDYRNVAEKRLDEAHDLLSKGSLLLAKQAIDKIKDDGVKSSLMKEYEVIEGYVKLREEIYELPKNYDSDKYKNLQAKIDAITDQEVREKLQEELKTVISNMGSVFNWDLNPSDPKYKGLKPIKSPITLYMVLLEHGSSVDKLNLQIQAAVDMVGVGTRQAPVAAGVTLIETLADYGYYIIYKWGGKRYKLGVDGNWGKITSAVSCNTYPGGEAACQQTQIYSGFDCSGFVNWALIQGFRNEHNPTEYTRVGGKDVSLRGQTTAICNIGDVLVSGGHIVMVAGLDDANKRYIIIESGGGHGGVGMAYKSYNDGGYYCRKINYSN